MVAHSVKTSEVDGEVRADKIVIVTGPTFGTTLKLMALGAVIGASAALYWKNQQEKNAPPPLPEPVSDEVASRMHKLSARAKAVAARARDLVHSATEIAGPALQQAISEGKAAARETEKELHKELDELKKDSSGPEQV